MKVHSHYENLRVGRNAPPEVIRAAYRALCQLHHPDLNSKDVDSNRKLAIINRAYETLIDSEKRREHDEWIEDQEWEPDEDEIAEEDSQSNPEQCRDESSTNTAATAGMRWTWRPNQLILWIGLVTGGMVLAYYPWENYSRSNVLVYPQVQNRTFDESIPPTPSLTTAGKQNTFGGTPTASRRLEFAPNGRSWPAQTGYLRGYPILHQQGNSTIRINNTSGIENWNTKLVSVESDGLYDVRYLLMKTGDEFILKDVLAGKYELHFQSLADEKNCWKSPVYLINEERQENGIRYTTLSLTIFGVKNGNLEKIPIDPAEF